MPPQPVDMRFAPAAFMREDHFPGAPCVPGSCLLEAVRRAAEQAFARPVLEVTQARFRRFVRPGQACRLYWKLPGPAAVISGAAEAALPVRVSWQLREAADPSGGARLAEGELRLAAAGAKGAACV